MKKLIIKVLMALILGMGAIMIAISFLAIICGDGDKGLLDIL